jgi:hypothetical protein
MIRVLLLSLALCGINAVLRSSPAMAQDGGTPMTEEECHLQRGEWVPHTRVGGFPACAFGSQIEQLDRIEAMLRAICDNQHHIDGTADCPEETK